MSKTEPSPMRPTLRRNIRTVGILQVALGSIIGSGWLFGALFAAQVAGPAAIISWLIGTAAMAVLALVHAELGSMHAVSGGSGRFTHFAFGSTAGFGIAWFAWISGAATAPIEVEAALQYATNYLPGLSHSLDGVTVLQPVGYIVAVALLAVFTLINLFAVKLISRINSLLTWWKVGMLVLTIVVIISVRFQPANFTAAGGFAPFGLHGVLAALSLGGVIFAFTGFEQAVQLGGETRNPGRNIPLAVLGSLAIVAVLYIGLQIAFLGGLEPRALSHGWGSLSFSGIFGPFAGLATMLGLGWLAYLLYIDAFLSPASNGLIYVTTTSRLAYGMARTNYIPAVFGRVDSRTRIPVVGVISSFVVGIVCLLPFPGWQTLVGFVTSAIALMWAGAPIALGALRRLNPTASRPFRLRGAGFLAPAGFVIANLVVYWSGWEADWKLVLCSVFGFALFAFNYLKKAKADRPNLDMRSAIWIAPWLLGLALISYLGTFSSPEHLLFGLQHIPFGWDMVAVVALSVAVYYFAMATRLPQDRADAYMEATNDESDADPFEPADPGPRAAVLGGKGWNSDSEVPAPPEIGSVPGS